ncbi:MAG TPA: AbgT family transporter, partial [Bacteroidaceae bacterium]|nr:AbgT family transporter [Bacteroidaceae bacterium]
MNKIERPYPHLAVIYLSLLIMVVLVSWIGSVYESRNANLGGETILCSLLNAQGLRWLIKTPATALTYAPIGNALLILAGTGIGARSGWFRAWRVFFSTCS